jgi:DNA-binding beta-propeller fold protein YncE
VSSEHLPYRVRTLFALAPFTGNQQGLAEHAGTVYVAADLGADGTRIDLRSRASGALIRSIGPLRLGHAAEISVGSDGLLYVVNGGPATDTKVFVIDPDSGRLLRTLDVSRLGVSGLLATDPGADRLLVYSETADGYRVTPVDLQGRTVGPAVPLPDEGVPQGLEIVHGELWLYTSPPTGNRITRFDPATGRLLGTIELAMSGEGEGLAVGAASGEVLVGAHGPSRVGILEAVPDE